MRKLSTAICLALCATNLPAADFGIGVSARSDDAVIYVPINVTETFRLEPSVRYLSTETSSSQTQDAIGFGAIEGRTAQEIETIEIGIGAFRVVKVAESAQLYFGLRAAYVDSTSTLNDVFSLDSEVIDSTHIETSQDGYRAGPAIGFEYLFGSRFSIGGEASYSFVDIEGTSTIVTDTSIQPVTLKSEQKSNGTATRLILRYRF